MRSRSARRCRSPASAAPGESLKDTPAEGRVWAKTGSMSHVRSLSGYLDDAERRAARFSILANNFRVPAAEIDALLDRALLRLVEFPGPTTARTSTSVPATGPSQH